MLAGNCGDSWPRVEDLTFAEWLSKLEEVEKSINIAMLVGHNTVRDLVMGDDFKRHATPDEIEKMKELVDEAMRSGAFGMSAGLDYYPGEYADTGELIELAKVVAIYRGMYVPHLRHCNSHWQAIDQEEWGYGVYHGPIEDAWVGKYRGLMEAIEVCRNSKVNLHLAHMYPAEMLGLDDRGTLSPGSYADIVIFDFNRIKMTGTFLNPAQHPEGIEYVLVNGTIVYKDMAHTGEKPGRLIRHSY